MNVLKIVAAALLVSGLSGCVTAISQADRTALRRVYIAPFQLPEEPVFYTESRSSVLGRGAVARAIEDNVAGAINYLCALDRNGIDVAARVLSELKDQLSAKGLQIVDEADQADAVLEIDMIRWGITPGYASNRTVPHFWAKFKLTNREGDVIWRDYPSVKLPEEIAKKVKPYPFSDYLANPQLLDSQIADVNRIVIRSVLGTL